MGYKLGGVSRIQLCFGGGGGGGEAQRRALAWTVHCHILSEMTNNFVRKTDYWHIMKETCPRPLEASEGIEGILVCHTI
jgi:hypothetical protein